MHTCKSKRVYTHAWYCAVLHGVCCTSTYQDTESSVVLDCSVLVTGIISCYIRRYCKPAQEPFQLKSKTFRNRVDALEFVFLYVNI